MSVKAMGLAWYVGDLTPAQKAVLVALADHANDDGNHIYPSVKRLGIKTSYAERTVRRALSDLRDMGLIRVVREATHHSPTEYSLDLPEMQARQVRPARDAPHDLPESPSDLPENTVRPARDAPKPSNNHQEPSAVTSKDETPPLPVYLATESMLEVWDDWCDYHKQRGKPLTLATSLKQFQQFKEWGVARSIDAINNSITNNYTGLVEPKSSTNRGATDDTMSRLDARLEAINHE